MQESMGNNLKTFYTFIEEMDTSVSNNFNKLQKALTAEGGEFENIQKVEIYTASDAINITGSETKQGVVITGRACKEQIDLVENIIKDICLLPAVSGQNPLNCIVYWLEGVNVFSFTLIEEGKIKKPVFASNQLYWCEVTYKNADSAVLTNLIQKEIKSEKAKDLSGVLSFIDNNLVYTCFMPGDGNENFEDLFSPLILSKKDLASANANEVVIKTSFSENEQVISF